MFNYLVVGVSMVVREILIALAVFIGFFSRTKETKFIMLGVFWIIFINYGVIYLAASYDARNNRFTIWNEFFDGLYPDFNALWFNDVGVLIVTIMMSNMYWPILEYFIFLGLRLLYRMIDQRSLCPTSSSKTTSKSIGNFVEVYAGPEFELHYKYAYILVVVFVTFLFGAGLPILFPIGWLSIFNLYVVERLMMAYSYQQPIMFGTETNQACLKVMLIAPILYCVMAAWLYSNRQIFLNDIHVNSSGQYLFQDYSHKLTDLWKYVTPGLVYFIFLFLVLIGNFGKMMINKISRCTVGREVFKEKTDAVNQNLEPFDDSLTRKQLNAYFAEEQVCRKKFGFNRLLDNTFAELKKDTLVANMRKKLGIKSSQNLMSGHHTYNMLAEEKWCFKFNYVPYTYPNREDYIVSMFKHDEMKALSVDVVRLATEFCYMPQDRAQLLEFNPIGLREETEWVAR